MTNKRKILLLIALAVSTVLLLSCAESEKPNATVEFQSTTPATATNPVSSLTSVQAASHVGERATVCGTVADTNYASTSNGRPTFLNFDKPYPRHDFTVVIWGSERRLFPDSPESFYRNKRVCANGLIELYKGKAQIIARSESQLTVQ